MTSTGLLFIQTGLLLLACSGVCYCANGNDKTIVVRWNEVVLDAARQESLGPPMLARALAIVHTCMYDAWASYDTRAIGTQLGTRMRRPKTERTMENKKIAVSYAAYRAAVDLFPRAAKARVFERFMTDALEYDPNNTSSNIETAVGVGNVTCNALLAVRHHDGSNQLGDMSPGGVAYADYTSYGAINQPSEVPVDVKTVTDPNRYQPLLVPAVYPAFVGAQWFKVTPFAERYATELSQVYSRFPLARYGSEQYQIQSQELVDISANLTDEEKMISNIGLTDLILSCHPVTGAFLLTLCQSETITHLMKTYNCFSY